jgi:hypothetical protein
MGDLGRIVPQCHRLQGVSKGPMAVDVSRQYPSLSHNLRSDGVKLVATDMKDSLFVRKGLVDALPSHGGTSNG